MDVSDFDYELPGELIAQYPLERGSERLLVVDRSGGGLRHTVFADFAGCLDDSDLLVLNDTRVIPARLLGRKTTGGRVEVFLLKRVAPGRWTCLMRSSKPVRPGGMVLFDRGHSACVIERDKDTCVVELSDEKMITELGQVPLPPYIDRAPQDEDAGTYQTVYARHDGSVAAPTAGLHFTSETLARLQARSITIVPLTLHVGPGTFQPVRTARVEDHHMHAEDFHVSEDAAQALNRARAQGRRIVAVGTTTTRVLESLMARYGEIVAGPGTTDIFIYPGYKFRCIAGMLTNFHLPRSTLLMLVAAFGGYELIMRAYREARERGYRFYSYGDAMFIA